jgi:hypothetical protein
MFLTFFLHIIISQSWTGSPSKVSFSALSLLREEEENKEQEM